MPAVGDLGDAIRNTANSTLTLLYTLAIFIWGLTLNRARAWRTDGGTAAFGIIALILGVTGTAINFLEVKEDRMRWLPDVISCVLLWQSWMGFWWWVGAGMWTGEAEDVNRKEERARRKEDKKRQRREAAFALQLGTSASASAPRLGGPSSSTTTRRRTRATEPPLEEIEMNDFAGPRAPRPPAPDESVSSGSTPPPVPHVLDPLIQLFRPFLARLRVAHDEAVVGSAALPPGLPDDVKRGWGIRALMMRGKRERGERRAAVGLGAGGGGEVGAGERRAGFTGDGAEVLEDDEDDDDDDDQEDWEDDRSLDGDSQDGRRTDRRHHPPRQPVEPGGPHSGSCFNAFLTLTRYRYPRPRNRSRGSRLAWTRDGRRAVVDLARRDQALAAQGRAALLSARHGRTLWQRSGLVVVTIIDDRADCSCRDPFADCNARGPVRRSSEVRLFCSFPSLPSDT